MRHSDLETAFNVGRELARQEFEKTAFLGSIYRGGKFLLGMGHMGKAGSGLSRISGHHIGTPLGFGLMGAASAEEGEKSKAFIKGLAGGLAFNALMPLGASIGKRIFAPGFSGKGSSKLMKSIGFSDEATAAMKASQNLNKALRSRQGLFRGVSERALGSGNFRHSSKLTNYLDDVLKLQENYLPRALRTRLKDIRTQLGNKSGVLAKDQTQVLKDLQDISSKLYKGGFRQGTTAQQRALKGLRFSKGLGIAAGGMGLGMMGSHALENTINTTPASYFNSTGGH